MLKQISALMVLAIALAAGPARDAGAAEAVGANLTGAWEGSVQFKSGAFGEVKDLRFMYAFHADGTMFESSNYDSAPPVPPAYGVWKKMGERTYLAKYRFYTSRPVASADELVKGGGWAPGGYGILTETITLAADGNSFESTIVLELFDASGKVVASGDQAAASAKRLGF